MWFSGSADKACATVRDRYGQLPPQYVPPARRRSFRLTAKRTLIDTTIIKTRERQAHMFQFQNRFRPGFTHIFNRVLVTDIVRPFTVSYICHSQLSSWVLPSATVIPPCAETVWERVGKTLEQRTGLATLGNLQRRAHTCAASTNHNCIKFSDWQFHHTPHTTTNP